MALLAGCCLLAQRAFDVASFKRHPAGAPHRGATKEVTPTRLTLHNATLGLCILWAYGYENWRVIGPNWRDYPTDVVYEIDARTDAAVSEPQMMQMLGRLLKERLGLEFHTETRDLPVYALVLAKGGPKFQKSASEGEPKISSAGGRASPTRFERFTMARFASGFLDPPYMSRHTIDETGLTGIYDFTFDIGRYILDENGAPIVDSRGAVDEEGAYIRGLPEQLGLRLEKKTASMEVLVVDRVEKDPSAN
jgi:uncharacterized protein (TIGR03435 family)